MPVIDLKELAIKLQNIFSRINLNTIDPEEIDAYLDKRDGDPFDSGWSSAYKQVEEQKKVSHSKKHPKDVDVANRRLREWVFKQVMKETESSDLASYLSDDFGLIFDALADTSITQSGAFHIFEMYRHGTLPSGQILVEARPSI